MNTIQKPNYFTPLKILGKNLQNLHKFLEKMPPIFFPPPHPTNICQNIHLWGVPAGATSSEIFHFSLI